MLKLAADEDFNNRIIRGSLRRAPALDLVRVQDAGLRSRDDASVLEWAANEARVLLTHDVTTMRAHAYARIGAGLGMPGVFEVAQDLPIGVAITEILILAECSLDGEWEGQVRFLPLK
jgi:uncharacterized protein DUF5615